MATVTAPRSLWVASAAEPAYAPLEGPLDVDVAVVGAGIAGVTTACLLKRAGATVALVDSKRVGHGATGYTTAKVTAAHGLTYATLVNRFGP